MNVARTFADLPALATHLQAVLHGTDAEPGKRFVLLYAHNGVGKTRLSMAFKDLGRQGDDRDTLYFNAYTEDLFGWDNDLANDSDRKLVLNANSRFFAGLAEMEMDIGCCVFHPAPLPPQPPLRLRGELQMLL